MCARIGWRKTVSYQSSNEKSISSLELMFEPGPPTFFFIMTMKVCQFVLQKEDRR